MAVPPAKMTGAATAGSTGAVGSTATAVKVAKQLFEMPGIGSLPKPATVQATVPVRPVRLAKAPLAP